MTRNVNKPAFVLLFAAGSSLLFTAGVMTLHAVTEPAAMRAARLYEQKAMVELFDLAPGRELTDEQVLRAYEQHIRPVELRLADPQTGAVYNDPDAPGSPRTFAAVEPDPNTGGERVMGYAFPVWGVGFWAQIEGYLAVSPDLGTVLGAAFLRHSETPGLGGRITEKGWREQFEGLKLTAPPQGQRFLYVGGEKPSGPGSPRYRRHVDAITGATGTSKAVEEFLNRRIAEFRRAAAGKLVPADVSAHLPAGDALASGGRLPGRSSTEARP